MKKIATTLICLMLIGAGCAREIPKATQPIDLVTPEPLPTYTNTIIGYTVTASNPDDQFETAPRVGGPATSSTLEVYLSFVGAQMGDAPFADVAFIGEKTTVYPENKINQLRGRYFKGNKNVSVTKATLDGKEGWEMKNNNETISNADTNHVIFIPYNGYDFLVVITGQTIDSNEKIVQSLHFTK